MADGILTYLPLLFGLLGASVFAGLIAGFLGVGGGIVLVPSMFWMFGFIDFPQELAMHMAVATSLGTIIFTSISSARAHYKRGSVDLELLKVWGPLISLGALSGGLLSQFFDPSALTAVFGCVGLLVALNFLRPNPLIIADRLPENKSANGSIAVSIGVVSALMGIGGGTLGVPTLSAFSYPIKKAVGTSAAFGLLIAVPATIGFIVAGSGVEDRPPFSLGYISIPAVLAIIPVTTTLAPVGARLAHKLGGNAIKFGFALFLGVTSLRMLSTAVGWP